MDKKLPETVLPYESVMKRLRKLIYHNFNTSEVEVLRIGIPELELTKQLEPPHERR